MSKSTKRLKKPGVLTFGEVHRRMKKNWKPGPRELPAVKAAIKRKEAVCAAENGALRSKTMTVKDMCRTSPSAKPYAMTDRWATVANRLSEEDERLRFVKDTLQKL